MPINDPLKIKQKPMQSNRFQLNQVDIIKWCNNLVLFSAPILASFFYLLSTGVPLSKAWPVALLALYGALSDLFKKWATGPQS